MSGEPLDVPLTPEQQALADRIDARIQTAVAAGAARLPFPPPKESTVRTYDPSQVKVTFNGVELKGFADGADVNVERDEDGWTKTVGSLGAPNRGGKFGLTLIGTSGSSDFLRDPHPQRRFWVLDPGAQDAIATFEQHANGTITHASARDAERKWQRWLKLDKRRELRARMRARKRRRGW